MQRIVVKVKGLVIRITARANPYGGQKKATSTDKGWLIIPTWVTSREGSIILMGKSPTIALMSKFKVVLFTQGDVQLIVK